MLGLGRECLTGFGPTKERKDNPREGWEDDGTTPPPHRDFKERSVVVPPLAVAHPWASASSEAEAVCIIFFF